MRERYLLNERIFCGLIDRRLFALADMQLAIGNILAVLAALIQVLAAIVALPIHGIALVVAAVFAVSGGSNDGFTRDTKTLNKGYDNPGCSNVRDLNPRSGRERDWGYYAFAA